MKKLLLICLALFQLASLSAQDFFSDVDEFMSDHVSNGLVDYKAIKAAPGELNDLLDQIAGANTSEMEKNERKAFYINSYNLLVIKSVVNEYPISSPLDVEGFFKGTKHEFAGKSVTLSELENDIIYGEFPDARLHFALVCAALGCPPIIKKAYRPEKLETQLTAQTTAAVNKQKFVKPLSFPTGAKLSQIFEWYASDFERDGGSVIKFINKYRDEDLLGVGNMVITYSEYDWTLNEQ